ncbi:chitin synthase-like [Pomacea canaliculata]|uniref:chitin synthase-like n=1 Tax=Pomacea canaliculata TaxID=400727 RepID=UPI000D72F9D9|nr:chitin synthase-like [Pomacea canaliculata]
MRLMTAIVFFGAVGATAIVSRLSLLVMTFNIRPHDFFVDKSSGDHYKIKEKNQPFSLVWVWALILVMAAPYVFTAVSCLWKIIFKKTQPLRCQPLVAALVVETLHSVGLCLLVFYVLPSFDPLIGCFLLLNVGFFPDSSRCSSRHQKHKTTASMLRNRASKMSTPSVTRRVSPRKFWTS